MFNTLYFYTLIKLLRVLSCVKYQLKELQIFCFAKRPYRSLFQGPYNTWFLRKFSENMVVKYAVVDEKRVEVCCNGVLCIQQLPLRFLLLQNEEFAFYYLYHYYFNCRCIAQTVLTALSFVIIIIGSITPQDARSIIDFINVALTLYLVITAVGRSLDQQCSIIFR